MIWGNIPNPAAPLIASFCTIILHNMDCIAKLISPFCNSLEVLINNSKFHREILQRHGVA